MKETDSVPMITKEEMQNTFREIENELKGDSRPERIAKEQSVIMKDAWDYFFEHPPAIDVDLQAIAVIQEILDSLPRGRQRRTLVWLNDRYDHLL